MKPIVGKVLVVDDDRRNLAAIGEILKGPGVEIVLAGSGEEALRWALREEFAVILLDVRMPGMDGYEIAGFIRARARSSRTPIIFLTGLSHDELHVFRGYSAGAVDFVFKPVQPLILKSKVDVFVELYLKTEEIRRRAEQERNLLLQNLKIRDEKLAIEQSLRRREEHHYIILRSLPIALYTQQLNGEERLLGFADDSIEWITGFPAKNFLMPGFWESRLDEEDQDKIVQELSSLSRTGVATLEYRWRCADEKLHYFLDRAVIISNESGVPREIYGIWLDVTERRELEQQLIHTSKLEAVGRFTGGIAHEFNNMLSIVVGNLDLLRGVLDGNDKAQNRVQLAIDGAQRCAAFTNQLLSFSRKQPAKSSVVSLSDRLPAIIDFVKPSMGKDIEFELASEDISWPVFVDEAQFEAALVNLLINARDAMPHGGRLTMSVANDEQRQMVKITVTDTGIGMTQDILDKAFDPFFTTKERGGGTGLGLSIVYGFVNQSKGNIEVASTPGKGTTIRLFLPRHRSMADESNGKEVAEKREPLGRSERVLIVDDDEDVRQTTASMLGSLGYSVAETDSADAALAILEQNPDFDLIVSDVKMPGSLDGTGLAHTVRKQWPAIPVLLMSGFVDSEAETSAFALLKKPFEASRLAARVREILNTGTGLIS
jgi:signal transduction histidine kinase